jgi:hypothetical protein
LLPFGPEPSVFSSAVKKRKKLESTIILPVALYRHEHRLKVSENRVLRRIFGPKRYEVTGEQRKLHNEELHDLYS